MKKILLATLIFCATLNAQELTNQEIAELRNYNHSMSGKLRYKRTLNKIAKISRQMAEKIVLTQSGETINYSKLKRLGNRLLYTIRTDKYRVKIDALDGSIISKERLE